MIFGRMRTFGSAAAFVATSLLITPAAQAAVSTYNLVNSTGVSTAYCCGNPVAIDPGVSVTASAMLTGATVAIELGFVPSEDALSLPSPVGNVTASYAPLTGVLTLSGTDTGANYQAALRSVTYTDTAPVANTSPRTITFGLGAAVAYSGTGHFYEFVPGSMIWTSAVTAAAAQSYLGLTGYLATITSPGENAFLLQKAGGDGWIGASTNGVDGFPRTWYWVTGPEAGESFFNNTGAGQGTTTAMQLPYANWNNGEPNDSGGSETVGEFYGNGGTSGFWNDLQTTNAGAVEGYFCEFGGTAGDPVESLQGSKTLVFLETTLTLASSANPSEPDASVTFTATLSPVPTSGTVTFTSSDNTSLGGSVAISGGTASVTTSALNAGADTITASASYVVGGNTLTASTALTQLVQVSCPSGESACPVSTPTFCANEQTDSNNCGACGTICPLGQQCSAGSCACPTATPNACRSGSSAYCANFLDDSNNCGACGTVCVAGESCGTGHCAVSCVSGQTNCAGLCTTTDIDNHNCGACGTVCAAGEVCDGSGHCAVSCVAGEANCAGLCTTTSTDNQNCGACGTVCAAGQVCDGTGHCAVSCVAGETNCAGLCTTTSSDNHNCGACGTVCAAGQVCDGTGHCAVSCVSGETNCSGLCAATNTDNQNCGACGTVCAAGEVCDGTGHCAVSCVSGETNCSGLCTTTSSDGNNCGACGTVCSSGEACLAGECIANVADASADATTDASQPQTGSTGGGGGCGCRMTLASPMRGAAVPFALAALALARRRPRRAAASKAAA